MLWCCLTQLQVVKECYVLDLCMSLPNREHWRWILRFKHFAMHVCHIHISVNNRQQKSFVLFSSTYAQLSCQITHKSTVTIPHMPVLSMFFHVYLEGWMQMPIWIIGLWLWVGVIMWNMIRRGSDRTEIERSTTLICGFKNMIYPGWLETARARQTLRPRIFKRKYGTFRQLEQLDNLWWKLTKNILSDTGNWTRASRVRAGYPNH